MNYRAATIPKLGRQCMNSGITKDHPKQKLLFFVAQGLDESVRAAVRNFVLRLASLRPWLNGPPRFVNVHEEVDPGETPIETVGGYLEIYSAWPPWTLPREIDLQHLDEVTTLVTELCAFSRQFGVAIELELEGDLVGEIQKGEKNGQLADGLLGEWRGHLGL